MNTKDIRAYFCFTQKQLAAILGVKLRKVQNWDQRNSMDELLHLLIKLELDDLFKHYLIEKVNGIFAACSFAEYAAECMRLVRDEGADLPDLEEE